jgi:NAD(P)-dependent dehydrogenase (short-subunit alcohol dehydrogenase family)
MGVTVARRLSQSYRVLIADLDGKRAEASAKGLREEGGDVTGIQADITDQADVCALAAKAAEIGPFRALAHVAGLSPSLGDFATIIRVNLHGAALVTDALLPHAATGTAAVLIASLAAHGFTPDASVASILDEPADPEIAERLAAVLGSDRATPQLAYQLSKFALRSLCRKQAAAWGSKGARILSLSPGLIATPQGALEFQKSEGKMKLLAATPLAREGTMLEIADAVEFLLSDRASFISGTDILVDGGLAGTLGF